jgi:hypothetical protein
MFIKCLQYILCTPFEHLGVGLVGIRGSLSHCYDILRLGDGEFDALDVTLSPSRHRSGYWTGQLV